MIIKRHECDHQWVIVVEYDGVYYELWNFRPKNKEEPHFIGIYRGTELSTGTCISCDQPYSMVASKDSTQIRGNWDEIKANPMSYIVRSMI